MYPTAFMDELTHCGLVLPYVPGQHQLTHCGQVMPYGDRDVGQHWLR